MTPKFKSKEEREDDDWSEWIEILNEEEHRKKKSEKKYKHGGHRR